MQAFAARRSDAEFLAEALDVHPVVDMQRTAQQALGQVIKVGLSVLFGVVIGADRGQGVAAVIVFGGQAQTAGLALYAAAADFIQIQADHVRRDVDGAAIILGAGVQIAVVGGRALDRHRLVAVIVVSV